MPRAPQGRSRLKPKRDTRRLTAHKRGYDTRWKRASRAFLMRAENAVCAICERRASECVDHIDPPSRHGAPDSVAYKAKFWDESNWQGACIRCNSVKGNRETT